MLVTIQQLIENQESTIIECSTFIQLPGGQVFVAFRCHSFLFYYYKIDVYEPWCNTGSNGFEYDM